MKCRMSLRVVELKKHFVVTYIYIGKIYNDNNSNCSLLIELGLRKTAVWSKLSVNGLISHECKAFDVLTSNESCRLYYKASSLHTFKHPSRLIFELHFFLDDAQATLLPGATRLFVRQHDLLPFTNLRRNCIKFWS